MSTRVGVLGARGRMGLEVCRAVEAAEDLDLVAAIDVGAHTVTLAGGPTLTASSPTGQIPASCSALSG